MLWVGYIKDMDFSSDPLDLPNVSRNDFCLNEKNQMLGVLETEDLCSLIIEY